MKTNCDPGETPTPNRVIRSHMLFAVELQGHGKGMASGGFIPTSPQIESFRFRYQASFPCFLSPRSQMNPACRPKTQQSADSAIGHAGSW